MTDKLGDVFGSVFTRTELSETLTEICKMDPNFEKEQFLKDCEQDIIPNILEAIVRGDLEILEDWCFEAPFNVLATPLRQAQQMGYVLHSRVLGKFFLIYQHSLGPQHHSIVINICVSRHRQHQPAHGEDDGAGPGAGADLQQSAGDVCEGPGGEGDGGQRGQGDADHLRVGAVPGPGRARPPRRLEAARPLRQQPGAVHLELPGPCLLTSLASYFIELGQIFLTFLEK